MSTAVVVGSGPNGLAAAVLLAQQGISVTVLEAADTIGGGTRTAELTAPGLLHDVCSAVHPFGIASPYLSQLPLAEHGLTWRWPAVDLAHPLDDGTAGVMLHSLDDTAAGLGADGDRWRRTFGPLAEVLDDLAPDVLGPLVRLPKHPLLMARFGLRAGLPATLLWKRFRTEQAKALFAGSAAHAFTPLNRPATAGVGVMLVAAAHRHGWPVAEGGSQAITRALASLLTSLGGRLETGVQVDRLPDADVVLLNTGPLAAARISGTEAPRFRYGPGVFKVDLAVRGGIPWRAPACREAGTLHLGGTAAEVAANEALVTRGVMPERPFVLLAQQYLADPTRSVGDLHPVWAYAHVPAGWTGDATEAVIAQVERFAPGVRDVIEATSVMSPADYAAYNANNVGGDIAGGGNQLRQLVSRPRPLRPYDIRPGVFLCSASTPPGAGVHGMGGFHAAQRALSYLRSR
ncbi:MAG: FAD-dependent oxidoreductase [Frankiales bacterium]|nr:FAD-dependent oxidoreductase [Frankiales bacterium]